MRNRCGDAEGISFNLMSQGATAKSAAAPVHKKDTIRWQEFFVVLSQYLAIVICFVVNIIAKYLDWGGFKVVLEWNARGPLLFVFQHIYYLAEGFLISLIIVFGQKACEKWVRS